MKKFIALLLTVAVFVTISMPAAADFPGPPSTTKGAPITFVPLDPGATTKNYYEEPTTYWMPETITHPTTLPPETTTTTTAPIIEPKDTYLEMITVTAKTTIAVIMAIGQQTINIPTLVAAPLPPLKSKKKGKT